jgi:hypothetical protein
MLWSRLEKTVSKLPECALKALFDHSGEKREKSHGPIIGSCWEEVQGKGLFAKRCSPAF